MRRYAAEIPRHGLTERRDLCWNCNRKWRVHLPGYAKGQSVNLVFCYKGSMQGYGTCELELNKRLHLEAA